MYKHITLLLLLVCTCVGCHDTSEEDSEEASWIWPDQHKEMKIRIGPLKACAKNVTVSHCVTADKRDGRCVPKYLCSAAHTVISDGTGIIGIRSKTHPEPEIANNADIKCEAGKVCGDGCTCCALQSDKPATEAPPVDEKQRVGCGWRNARGVGFLIDIDFGDETHYGEFPWMVAILTVELFDETNPEGPKFTVYAGGGSLIHPGVILTAAHIVQPAWGSKTIRVRAGEWDLATKKEIYPHQQQDITDVEVHKGFNPGNLHYDIALLFPAKAFTLAPNVGLACLPPRTPAPRGDRCIAIVFAWGDWVTVKKIEMPVVAHDACQSQLRKTRLGDAFQLHSSFMCAGGEKNRDTCTGDGGSPLICAIEGQKSRYMQSGIVAWGIGCGQEGTPAVYTDVAGSRDWIDNTVRRKGLDPSSYTF